MTNPGAPPAPRLETKEETLTRVDGERLSERTGSTATISGVTRSAEGDEVIVDFLVAYYGYPNRAALLRDRPDEVFDAVALIAAWQTLL